VFALSFRTKSSLTWRFRIVDENFKLLKEYDWVQPPPNYNFIQFKTDDFPNDTIRVYYQVEKAGCVWRGHGDVLVEN
jgi:aminoglycoside phosphotransferase family enzyme